MRLVTPGGSVTQKEINKVSFFLPLVKATVRNEEATRAREATRLVLVSNDTHEYVEGLRPADPQVQH